MAVSGIVKIDAERCKGCELCLSACPKGVLGRSAARNGKGYYPAEVKKPADCVACAGCARICPDSAISVWREEERGA